MASNTTENSGFEEWTPSIIAVPPHLLRDYNTRLLQQHPPQYAQPPHAQQAQAYDPMALRHQQHDFQPNPYYHQGQQLQGQYQMPQGPLQGFQPGFQPGLQPGLQPGFQPGVHPGPLYPHATYSPQYGHPHNPASIQTAAGLPVNPRGGVVPMQHSRIFIRNLPRSFNRRFLEAWLGGTGVNVRIHEYKDGAERAVIEDLKGDRPSTIRKLDGKRCEGREITAIEYGN